MKHPSRVDTISGNCRGKENLWLLTDVLNYTVKGKVCLPDSDIFGNTDIAEDAVCVIYKCQLGNSYSETVFAHPTLCPPEEHLRSH